MSKTSEVVVRARELASTDDRVRGVVLYGSVARGFTHAHSDDLIIVGQAGQRAALWGDRSAIASDLLGADIEWSHELPWHGPYRYQAWRADLLAVDLTFDEDHVEPHDVFPTGSALVLAGDLELPPVDNSARPTDDVSDSETSVWLLGIHNQIQQNRLWDAYVQLVALIDNRLAPHLATTDLYRLVPAAVERGSLINALKQCVSYFEASSDNTRASAPLADAVRRAIEAAI